MSSSSLNGSTKKLQWKPHDCLCGSLRDLHGTLPKFTYFEIYNFEIKEIRLKIETFLIKFMHLNNNMFMYGQNSEKE